MLEAISFHNFHNFPRWYSFPGTYLCLLSFVAVSTGRGSPGLKSQEIHPVSAEQPVNEELTRGQPLAREEMQRSEVIHRGLAAVHADEGGKVTFISHCSTASALPVLPVAQGIAFHGFCMKEAPVAG